MPERESEKGMSGGRRGESGQWAKEITVKFQHEEIVKPWENLVSSIWGLK